MALGTYLIVGYVDPYLGFVQSSLKRVTVFGLVWNIESY